jgi:Ti-type conjugative transfer relaxase TraA
MWERIGNRVLEQAGLDIRIDCRSLVDQGLDREATVHLGPIASGLERKGEGTDLGDRNRAAQARNAERERMAGEREVASAQIIDLAAERARREKERELYAAVRTHSPPRILETLTDKRSTFSRTDLNRVLSKVIVDPAERARMTDRILALPDVVGLRENTDAPVSRYSTKGVLADESRTLEDAAALSGNAGHGIGRAGLAPALKRHPKLNDEQREALRHVTGAGGLALVAGEAGTGKSTTLAAVRDAYEAAGYRVIGMAWTNAVVQDMRRDGYRDAATIASELRALQTAASRWDGRTALIVDEAAMLSTRHLADVVSAARASGAKLILAGDDKQLASIERGGLFGALRERHGSAELHDVIRVSDAAQKRAFNLMHKGEFLPAVGIFQRQGAVHWKGKQEEAFDALVARWGQDAATDPAKTQFVFAYTNADVGKLNAALREVRKQQSALGPDHQLEVADGPIAFAVGDRVQFTGTAQRRDYRAAGLVNGAAGTVREIEGHRVTVALDAQPGARERLLSFSVGKDYASGEFDQMRHGYAGTIYKGQGRTLDRTYLYHSEHWRAASSYVALTRHRNDISLFVATETARDLGQLARQMARVDDCRAASQFVVDYSKEPPPPRQSAASGGRSAGLDPETYAILREARSTEQRQAQERDTGQGWDRSR